MFGGTMLCKPLDCPPLLAPTNPQIYLQINLVIKKIPLIFVLTKQKEMKIKNLPTGKYSLIGSTYVSLIDGEGTCCANCGRLIAELVTVKNEDQNRHFIIGKDCAKSLLAEVDYNKCENAIKSAKRLIEDAKRKERNRLADIQYNIRRDRQNHLLSAERALENYDINSGDGYRRYNELIDATALHFGVEPGDIARYR